MKKLTVMLSIIFVVLLMLIGCSNSESSSSKDGDVQEIKFMAAQYSNNTQPFLQKVIEDFEKENQNIKVNLEVVGWDALEQKVNTLVATNQVPDILNINHYAAFANDDLLMPLEEVISSELKDKMYQSFYDAGKLDGTAYGLPYLASIRGLFYNKDLFEKAGINEPPTTWDELLNVAKEIKDKTGKDGFGIPMTTLEGQAYFSYFIWGNNGDWKKDGEWVLNSPENVEALEFMTDLVKKHKVTNPEPTAINRDEMHKVFGSGEIGMMISANFLPTILKGDAPDLNYGVAPIPVNEGNDPINLGVQDFLVVFKSTKHPEAVQKFLDFLYSNERYEEFMTNEGMLPVIEEVGESMASKDETNATFIEQLPVAKFYPLNDPKFSEIRIEAINAVQKSFLQEQTPQEALDELQQKVK